MRCDGEDNWSGMQKKNIVWGAMGKRELWWVIRKSDWEDEGMMMLENDFCGGEVGGVMVKNEEQ